jgi:hypothetical protein
VTLIVHTARASAMPIADALHVSWPGNEASGEKGGHRGIGFIFCPTQQLRSTYQRKVERGEDSDRFWINCCRFYVDTLRTRLKMHLPDGRSVIRPEWQTLLSWEHVVLIGEEQEARRCFSVVLAEDVLRKMGATYMGEL